MIVSKHGDLSTAGRWYVGVVSAGGALVISLGLYHLAAGLIDPRWFILAGLTVLSASLTIKVPGVPAQISVSETFVFASVLYFGIPAGAPAGAGGGPAAGLGRPPPP